MSRAFIKEPDGDQVPDDHPAPKRGTGPHWVTPAGFQQLEKRRKEAADVLAMIPPGDRAGRQKALARLSGWDRRLAEAEVIDPRNQPPDQVRFGHTVTVRDLSGEEHRYTLVGSDQADFSAGQVAYDSPLGQALLGAQEGEIVSWIRPAGEVELEILAIEIPG